MPVNFCHGRVNCLSSPDVFSPARPPRGTGRSPDAAAGDSPARWRADPVPSGDGWCSNLVVAREGRGADLYATAATEPAASDADARRQTSNASAATNAPPPVTACGPVASFEVAGLETCRRVAYGWRAYPAAISGTGTGESCLSSPSELTDATLPDILEAAASRTELASAFSLP
jgi:hypothetical protein